MNSLKNRFDRWIFESWPVSAHQLSLLRIIYGGWVLLILGIPDYSAQVEHFPDGGFNPVPGFGRLFSGMPPLWTFEVSEWLSLIGFGCLMLGVATRFWSVFLPFLVLFTKSLIFASGKVDSSILPIIIPLVFAGSGWGAHYALLPTQGGHKHNVWPITLMGLLLGFGLATAGIMKVLGGWLSPEESMVRAFFVRNYYLYAREGMLTDLFLPFSWNPFWEFQDWMTIFFELGILVAVPWPKTYRLFTILAMVFHILVLLMLRISFLEFVIVYVLFWIPLISTSAVDSWWQRHRKGIILLMGGMVLLSIGSHFGLGQPSVVLALFNALGAGVWTYTFCILVLPTLGMLIWLGRTGSRWLINRRDGPRTKTKQA